MLSHCHLAGYRRIPRDEMACSSPGALTLMFGRCCGAERSVVASDHPRSRRTIGLPAGTQPTGVVGTGWHDGCSRFRPAGLGGGSGGG